MQKLQIITVEFENGDAEISRLDVARRNSGVDMWDVLETYHSG